MRTSYRWTRVANDLWGTDASVEPPCGRRLLPSHQSTTRNVSSTSGAPWYERLARSGTDRTIWKRESSGMASLSPMGWLSVGINFSSHALRHTLVRQGQPLPRFSRWRTTPRRASQRTLATTDVGDGSDPALRQVLHLVAGHLGRVFTQELPKANERRVRPGHLSRRVPEPGFAFTR